jgi:5-methylcytosine-specific restriction endonuclease McrA
MTKVCSKCSFEGDESLFRRDRNQCLPCRNGYEKKMADARRGVTLCSICDEPITGRRARPSTIDGLYRCTFCQKVRHNERSRVRMATQPRSKREPKHCGVCGDVITGKRPGPGRKDGLFRCTPCQKKRTREIATKKQNAALKGPKAEQYRATRNRAKRAWEDRNPVAKQARSLIKSVKTRLRQYDYDFERFRQPSTRELAKALAALPKHCIKCEATEDLTVEHIQPVVKYPELALEPTNLTTLCRSCNTRSFHGRTVV